jgi:hypothetical protein
MPRKKNESDPLANVFAGQLGISAVLANVLIDKGIIGRGELYVRLQQAHNAASKSVGGVESARQLGAMMSYIEKTLNPRRSH